LQVVRAVAYAHARLVIHRDLKPANVLVDAQGQAHLLDFGIARLMDAAAENATLTQEAARAYTPAYASPEQVLGQEIGVASDVYSLGVLLYELLAGVRPFVPRRDTPGATEELVLQGDAPPMSTRVPSHDVARGLRGDVDAIVAKAMKRDPDQRYATADALTQDIERHLKGEAVKARPDGVWYRLNKAVRRHRVAVGATAAVLLTVAVGSGATFSALHRSALAADRARQSAAFVSEMFRNTLPDPSSSAHGIDEPFIDRSARLIQSRFANQPDMQAELYGVVAKIYTDISAGPLAIDFATRQVDLLARLPEDRPRRAKARILLADALLKERRFEPAAEHARQALALVDEGADAWFEATALLAWAQIGQGKVQDARTLLTLAMQRRDVARRRESIGDARLLTAQANLLDIDNRFAESSATYQHALDEISRLEGPRSPAAADIRLLIVDHQLSHGRFQESRSLMDSVVADLRALGPAGRIRAAVESARFWEYCHALGDCSPEEARGRLEQSVAAIDAEGAAVPPVSRARIELAVGEFYIDLTDVRNARKWINSSLSILKNPGADIDERRRVTWIQSELAQFTGDSRTAVGYKREVLAIDQSRGEAEDPRTSLDWYSMALSAAIADGPEAAEKILDQAPTFAVDSADTGEGSLFPHMVALARVRIRLDQGDVDGATKAMPGPELEGRISNYIAMMYVIPLRAELLCRSGREKEGLQLFRAYVAQVPDVLHMPDFDPDYIRERAAFGMCALSAHDRALAVEIARAVRAALDTQPDIGSYYAKTLGALEEALDIKPAPASAPA
jgi:tetratricopeptide (TPR) repeat protein